MGYTKQNFQSGDILTAAALNDMDQGIENIYGYNTTAINRGLAVNDTTEAGWRSVAEGFMTVANNTSHAEGRLSQATGKGSHAEGTEAYSDFIDSEGNSVIVELASDYDITTNIVVVNNIPNDLVEGTYIILGDQNAIKDETKPETYNGTDVRQVIAIDETSNTLTINAAIKDLNYDETLTPNNSGFLLAGIPIKKAIPCVASARSAHAEGLATTASGKNSHAEGAHTEAISDCTHAEGGWSIAGYTSLDENGDIVYNGKYSHAEGGATQALGTASHSEGQSTIASGGFSHAEGHTTEASGSRSHAEGSETKATKTAAHAEGYKTIASGTNSHAEGQETTASGAASHAEGYVTEATKDAAHAEGDHTHALHIGAHTEGQGTVSGRSYQHIQGRYNVADANMAHIVGWGTSTTPANIHTLDTNGNAWYLGGIRTGGTIQLGENSEDYLPEITIAGNQIDINNLGDTCLEITPERIHSYGEGTETPDLVFDRGLGAITYKDSELATKDDINGNNQFADGIILTGTDDNKKYKLTITNGAVNVTEFIE